MKVLLSWLREFAPLERSPEAIGETLSDLGLAVEAMDRLGEGLDGVVVARVLALRPHPDADRIQLVDVDAGDGEAQQIGCGAFNIGVGDLVPLATVGSVLPNGTEIARRKLRGQWSNGMLCSPAELGFGADQSGIHLLPGDLPIGAPLTEALGIVPDVRYDLEVNPNRPDAMSVAGVARDLAARFGEPFTLPEPAVAESGAAAGDAVAVEILDPGGCGRFTARVLRGVAVGTSPSWMANRLVQLGMRPINSLVDISNYVMLELGQPSHPYDLAEVAGPAFRVRRATPGERLVTLDDVERVLDAEDLLICDGDDAAIGIAGVMGGARGEISDTTTEVAVEMAWFQPMAVARTSRRLGLRSEASARFEKGCDPEAIDRASARFAELAAELSGATSAPGLVDRRGDLPERPPVRLRTERLNRLLGTELSPDRIRAHLDPIGFTTTAVDGDQDVAIPSWRYDSAVEVDVIEEVARMHGYGAIARTVPPATRIGGLDERQQDRRRLRRLLMGLGLCEAMPLAFLAPGDLARCGLPDDGLNLLNPLVAEESVLRTSLLPGLVKTIASNAAHRNTGVALFEIGHTYRRPPSGAALPDEREHVAVALGGRDAGAAVEAWQVVAEGLGLNGVELVATETPGLHPTRTARIVVLGSTVGAVGEVDPSVLEAHGIGERVGWLEVDLDTLLAQPHGDRPFRPYSHFPSSDIDLAFVVDDATPAAAVEATIVEAAGDLLADIWLFDVYRGPQVEAGRRSLAWTLRLQAPDRTLTDAEVAEVRRACIAAVEAAHPARLRE